MDARLGALDKLGVRFRLVCWYLTVRIPPWATVRHARRDSSAIATKSSHPRALCIRLALRTQRAPAYHAHMRQFIFVLILLGAPSVLLAQGLDDLRVEGPSTLPQPEEQVIWKTDLQIRTNPLGIMTANRFVWREYHEADGSDLYRGTYQQASLDLNISPAFAEIGPSVEFRPINLFVYRVGYQALIYFGELGYALSFPSSDADFGEDVADALEDANAEQSGVAHRLFLEQTTQAQVGDIVIQNKVSAFVHFFPDHTFDGPFVRERMYDTLQADIDGLIVNQLAVLYQPWSRGENARVLVGPYHEIAYAARAQITRHRVGGILAAIPADVWGQNIHTPRFYVQAGVNVVDPNRDDQFFIQGGFGADLRLRTRTRE